MNPQKDDRERYDVVIMGGGLAGQTFARHMRLQQPYKSLCIIEKQQRPLPEACHKVGESSVEVSSHYYSKVLRLQEYFEEAQLPKLGLRFFFGDTTGPLEKRPEFGTDRFPPVPSFQLDRGIMENDLREMSVKMGVKLYEGASVTEIDIVENEDDHAVHFTDEKGEQRTVHARWVVDASGRRRMLQTKFGLKEPNGHNVSAVWWRMEGKRDIEKMVPDSNKEWQTATADRRWFSTNHLMGYGYWVWLIPLSSGHTSVGIVGDESIHPFKEMNTYDKAYKWLEKHEPVLAKFLGDDQPMDFLGYKNFSYHSKQTYSHNRWSCIGEAGIFSDPFYSPGSDFIAYANTITAKMIEMDSKGILTKEKVDTFNNLYLNHLGEFTVSIYRDQYTIWGCDHVMISKIFWDTCAYWVGPSQLFFRNYIVDTDVLPDYLPRSERHLKLHKQMQFMFREWAAKTDQRSSHNFVPYYVKYYRRLHVDLMTDKTPEKFFADIDKHMLKLEAWANVMFRQAVKECLPDQLDKLPKWVNAYAVSLDPSKWEADGLFKPDTDPQDLSSFEEEMDILYQKNIQAPELNKAA